MDKNYYDLLRIFSNELEKENSVLFVLGFSMADEHISEIVTRSIESNPTLMVYIFAYDQEAQRVIVKNINRFNLKYKKLRYIVPSESMEKESKKYTLTSINKLVFKRILNKIKTED